MPGACSCYVHASPRFLVMGSCQHSIIIFKSSKTSAMLAYCYTSASLISPVVISVFTIGAHLMVRGKTLFYF